MMMKTYIYINWETQEYYTNWDDVVEAYRSTIDGCEFNDYLYDHYSYEEVFYFTEEQRAEVLKEYNELERNYIDEWVRDHLEKVEVKIEVKGE